MKKVTVKVVGIKQFKSKKDEDIAIVYIEYKDKDTEGVATDSIFVIGADTDKVHEEMIEEEIDVIEHNFKHFLI